MSYFEDAKELLKHASNSFNQIKKSYNDSLYEKSIKPNLLIEIKNFMENLRSALDYSACGLYHKYGDEDAKHAKRIYFPYAKAGSSKEDFKSILDRNIPLLSTNRPDIAQIIGTYQLFSDPMNDWLPKFMDLINSYKHQQLTPQLREEVKQLKISSDGCEILLGEGCKIDMGAGCFIKIGGATLFGSQTFDVNNPAKILGDAKQEVITWVSFNFQSNNEPVLPLLEKSLYGVTKIVNHLSLMGLR